MSKLTVIRWKGMVVLMKVILVNGSPHRKGCTYTALSEIVTVLENEGIETEIFQLGTKPISGCIGCGVCRKKQRCFIDDSVNEFVEKAKTADAFIFGSPVHYAALSGSLTAFLDRVFYSASPIFNHKPGAGIVSCRRGGATAAFDQLNKYFTINQMPVVSSQYWNMVHGNDAEEVKKDLEGLQTMRVLGNNVAWLLKCIDAGKKADIQYPQQEPRIATNFIR